MKDIFIVACGPSARNIDLKKLDLNKAEVACVNSWPISYIDDFFYLKPQYIFLLDPIYYIDKNKVDNVNESVNILRNILNRVDWKMTVVIQKNRKFEVNNDRINFEYINTHCILKKKLGIISYVLMDYNIINPGFHNVAIGATYFFLRKKFKRIFLVGVDISDFKNMHVDFNNRVYIESEHSYGKSERLYYDEYDNFGITSFSEWLNTYVLVFKEFEAIAKYMKYKKAEVYNLSLDSYVDVFMKMDFKEYIKNN